MKEEYLAICACVIGGVVCGYFLSVPILVILTLVLLWFVWGLMPGRHVEFFQLIRLIMIPFAVYYAAFVIVMWLTYFVSEPEQLSWLGAVGDFIFR